MPRIRLTATSIAKLKAPHPSGKQQLFWDEALTGFGLVVSGTTNAKSFIVQRDINGRTRRVTIGPVNVFDEIGGVDEARRRAKLILADVYAGKDLKPNLHNSVAKATLKQVLDDYLEARKDLKESTRQGYRNFVLRYLTPWCDVEMRGITGDMAVDRHTAIQKEVADREAARRRRQGLEGVPDAPGTIKRTGENVANMAMVTLKTLWAFQADRVPGFPENPTKRLKGRWYPTTRRERIVPPDRLGEFYEAVDSLQHRGAKDFLKLVIWTGLRKTEAASLKWSSIDFANRVIRLPASVTKSGRKLDLPMSTFVFDLLVARRAVGIENEHVFPGGGALGYYYDPSHALAEVANKCGIRVSVHDLRRGYITVAASSGISVWELKLLVNHSVASDDITGGYIITDLGQLRAAAEKVSDRLRQLCVVPQVKAAENVAVIAR